MEAIKLMLLCVLTCVADQASLGKANNSSIPPVSSQPYSTSGPAEAINRLCIEEGNNKISAIYNRTIYDLRGTAGICLCSVNYHHQSQLQREVVGCLDKTSPDRVCAGNNSKNPCTVIGETAKIYFNVPGWNNTYVIQYKFKREGHFYRVERDICWHIRNSSKVQAGNSAEIPLMPSTAVFSIALTKAGNSSEIPRKPSTAVSSSACTKVSLVVFIVKRVLGNP